jgi:hypothetical protein
MAHLLQKNLEELSILNALNYYFFLTNLLFVNDEMIIKFIKLVSYLVKIIFVNFKSQNHF